MRTWARLYLISEVQADGQFLQGDDPMSLPSPPAQLSCWWQGPAALLKQADSCHLPPSRAAPLS